jgi:hypothetical protein
MRFHIYDIIILGEKEVDFYKNLKSGRNIDTR